MKLTQATLVVSSALLVSASSGFAQTILYQEDFNSNNGGATTLTINTPAPSDPGNWTYSSTIGVGGSGAWFTAGGQTLSYPGVIPFEQQLILPVQNITVAGDIALSFDHRYDFEADATDNWDGGLLMVNINGGGFTQVSNFTLGGYTGAMQTDFDWGYTGDFNGLVAWTGNSGGYLTSIADLGTLEVGDTVEVMFRGGWDWFVKGGNPNWSVDNLVLTSTPVPEPEAYALILGIIAMAVVVFKRKLNKETSDR
jgi:hypothetical protein